MRKNYGINCFICECLPYFPCATLGHTDKIEFLVPGSVSASSVYLMIIHPITQQASNRELKIQSKRFTEVIQVFALFIRAKSNTYIFDVIIT